METITSGVFDIQRAAREAGVNNINRDVLKSLSVNQYIKIKSWEDLLKDFGSSRNIPNASYLDSLCGRRIRINQTIFDRIQQNLNFIADVPVNVGNGKTITASISRAMVEPVKKIIPAKNVKGFSLLAKKNSPEIIEKMKSLVDRDVFRSLMTIGASHKNRVAVVSEKQIDAYLDLWANSKYPHFMMMGQKLIIEHPIDYKISQSDMDVMVKELIEKFPKYAPFLLELQGSILENSCEPNVLLEMYFYDVFKKGMKVSKFLSKVLQDPKFDIEFSKVLQNRIEKGFIKISIDPCDFLTMSFNKHKWSSCQNIYGGAWSNAAFSLMCDNSTIVVYKDDGKIYKYEGENNNWDTCGTTFKWNSKQSRELINLDVNTCAMSFNKTYPNMSKELIGSIRQMLEKLVSDYVGAENNWEVYEDSSGIRNRKIIGKFHYHDPVICQAFLKNNPRNFLTEFVTGRDNLPCPVCGNIMDGTQVQGRMICASCQKQENTTKCCPGMAMDF